jgi:uncharacterized protein involved in exopolysaccharide biosynthesis
MGVTETVALLSVMAVIASVVVPLARALARRIAGGPERATQHQVQALREEVDQLRGELDAVHERLAGVDELHNRVDFAERLLAQARDRGVLGPAKEAS